MLGTLGSDSCGSPKAQPQTVKRLPTENHTSCKKKVKQLLVATAPGSVGCNLQDLREIQLGLDKTDVAAPSFAQKGDSKADEGPVRSVGNSEMILSGVRQRQALGGAYVQLGASLCELLD